MNAFGTHTGAEGKIRMLSDFNGAATRAMGLEMEAPIFNDKRCKRTSMVVVDGVVQSINIATDDATCTYAGAILAQLK
jgi:peroxiredoxin